MAGSTARELRITGSLVLFRARDWNHIMKPVSPQITDAPAAWAELKLGRLKRKFDSCSEKSDH